MSKNCLECAFCTRNRNTWRPNQFKPEHSRWNNRQALLTTEERLLLKDGSDDFIGKDIRDAEAWDERFETERENVRKSYQDTPYAGILSAATRLSPFPASRSDLDEEAKTYGMSPRPDAPDKDYLSCFHNQWDENKNPSLQSNRQAFLARKRCAFFFSFQKTSGETLDACESMRKDALERSRFYITNGLIVLGIIVTVLVGVIPLFKH
jgi:hypothetical protein